MSTTAWVLGISGTIVLVWYLQKETAAAKRIPKVHKEQRGFNGGYQEYKDLINDRLFTNNQFSNGAMIVDTTPGESNLPQYTVAHGNTLTRVYRIPPAM